MQHYHQLTWNEPGASMPKSWGLPRSAKPQEVFSIIVVKALSSLLFASQGDASETHTQAGWITNDIEAEVAALKARGLNFEEYDTPSLKTINSIAIMGPVKAAWFKDSEGNLLGLMQFV